MSYENRRLVSQIWQLLRSRALGDAEREIENALELQPFDAELLALAAEIQRRLKKLEEAGSFLERAIELDPFHPSVESVAADLAFDRADNEEAARRYRELMDRKPSAYNASRLVLALNRLGRHDEAASNARLFLEQFPKDAWLLRGLAASEAKRGRRAEAIAAYEELLAREPSDRFAYKELMRLRTEDSAPDESARALRGLMRGGGGRDRNPHLKSLAGDRLKKAGKLEEAVACYQEALELEPANGYVLRQLGFTYKDLGESEKAFDVLSRAFIADPSNRFVRSSLLSLAKKTGELERLGALVSQAISAHPEDKTLYGIKKRIERQTATNDG